MRTWGAQFKASKTIRYIFALFSIKSVSSWSFPNRSIFLLLLPLYIHCVFIGFIERCIFFPSCFQCKAFKNILPTLSNSNSEFQSNWTQKNMLQKCTRHVRALSFDGKSFAFFVYIFFTSLFSPSLVCLFNSFSKTMWPYSMMQRHTNSNII